MEAAAFGNNSMITVTLSMNHKTLNNKSTVLPVFEWPKLEKLHNCIVIGKVV